MNKTERNILQLPDKWGEIIIPHPVQDKLIKDKFRFKVVAAGRRSGKSWRAKRNLMLEAIKKPGLYFSAAPTRDQVKRIYWNDLKEYTPPFFQRKDPSESELIIFLKNGSEIHCLGLDKPARVEGIPWSGGVVDEIDDCKPETWHEHLRPALDTLGLDAWCWLVGVPDGLKLLYEFAEYAKSGIDPEWCFYTWKSADILPPSVISAAKRQMSRKQYLQEYEACHLKDTEVILFNGEIKKISQLKINDKLIHLSDNGNYSPCTVLKKGKTGIKTITEVVLETGDTFKASSKHNMKVLDKKICLNECDKIEKHFIKNKIRSNEEIIAGLVGFNLGDGHCSIKRPNSYQIDFYSKYYDDIVDIKNDIYLAFNKVVKIKEKKDCYYVSVYGDISRLLVIKGCICGAKVMIQFGIPEWIMSGSDSVKISFLSGLLGAEGSTLVPASEKSKMPKRPYISMFKHIKFSKDNLFTDLKNLLSSLGIDSSITQNPYSKIERIRSTLYILSNYNNIYKFLSKIYYLYNNKREYLRWLWVEYLKCYKYDTIRLKDKIEYLRNIENYSWSDLSFELKMSGGKIKRIYNLNEFKRSRWTFPIFTDWRKQKEVKNGVLLLDILDTLKLNRKIVFNILVDSPDHSYLLANGLNNYNSFELATGRVYEDYNEENLTTRRISATRPIIWTHDFNFTPLSSIIAQEDDKGNIYIVDEIILESSVAKNAALEFIDRYKDDKYKRCIIQLYGDASGHVGSKHGHISDYMLIENMLRKEGFRVQVMVPRSNPPIKDGQNSLRAKICSASGKRSLFVNSIKCKVLDKGLKTVSLKEGSTFQEEDSYNQHVTTALRYYTALKFPVNRTKVGHVIIG